jgi:hypothetical protein
MSEQRFCSKPAARRKKGGPHGPAFQLFIVALAQLPVADSIPTVTPGPMVELIEMLFM